MFAGRRAVSAAEQNNTLSAAASASASYSETALDRIKWGTGAAGGYDSALFHTRQHSYDPATGRNKCVATMGAGKGERPEPKTHL